MDKKCKNKKCQRSLPYAYKHNYCENCRNEHVEQLKNAGKAVLGLAGSVMLVIVTAGKYKGKK